MSALLLLARYWRIALIAVLVGALGAQTWRVGNLKDDLRLTKMQGAALLERCQGNADRLSVALQTQNASLDALKREADASSARATAQIRAAQADSVKARRDVAAIMAKRPGGDLCASALELMREP